MSIQDLGAIGEFVSAIIIVVTLVYLALQSKQNQQLLRSAAFQGRTDTYVAMLREAAISPDFAEIILKNTNEEDLSPLEQRRLELWLLANLKSVENAQIQSELKVLDLYYDPMVKEVLSRAVAIPHMREVYLKNVMQFTHSFRSLMDQILEELDNDKAS